MNVIKSFTFIIIKNRLLKVTLDLVLDHGHPSQVFTPFNPYIFWRQQTVSSSRPNIGCVRTSHQIQVKEG